MFQNSCFPMTQKHFNLYISFTVFLQTISEYRLLVEARDMGGHEFGLCTTAEVIIEIKDINDNFPRLEQNMVGLSLLKQICSPLD